jgi:hypothetical protein
MARFTIDGVIEAVRYTPGGLIGLVRMYQRHGAVWSDIILLNRMELVEQLDKGMHFVTGTRKVSLGSVFNTGPSVRWIDERVVTEGQSTQRDLLVGVAIF